MGMRPRDTSPEAWKVFIDLHRAMPPEVKLQHALEFSEAVRHFAEAGLRQRYPGADEHEILLRYARMTLGRDLFRKAYGEALPEDGPNSRNA
jgi:hypothetical protein